MRTTSTFLIPKRAFSMKLPERPSRWILAALWCAATACPALRAQAADADFLDVAQAFQVSVDAEGTRALSIHLTAAPGYHLYRDRFAIEATPPATLPPADLPGGKTEYDA